jgi:ethanolaminephosphotransferase
MIPEYKYRCNDSSILTPIFKEKLVVPLFKLMIPWWIPANLITVIANLFMFGALAVALLVEPGISWAFLVAAFGVFGYVVGDHFDGMQAKRTQTGSALGEFFDHFHDIFNNGILFIIVFKLFGINNPYLVSGILMISYWAHASVFYEQYKTKWLFFEKIGSLEGVFLVIFMLLIGSTGIGFELFTTKLFGYKVIELILVGSALGTFITMVKTIIRSKLYDAQFFTFLLLLAVVAMSCSQLFDVTQTFLIITFYSVTYIGNVQRGHLVDSLNRFPNLIVPVALLGCLFINLSTKFAVSAEHVYLMLWIYLSASIVWIILNFIGKLRQFWVWKNPKLEK